MKGVSDKYKKSMRGLLRERSFCKISFGNVDVDAARDGVWDYNGAAPYSEVTTLDYSYTYESSVATLELNRWVLNNPKTIMPDNGEYIDGYASDVISDEDGSFASSGYPTLIREFSEPHTFRGLTITFDTRMQEWPLEFYVTFYQSGIALETKNGQSEDSTIDGATFTVRTDKLDIDKVEVTFMKMLPYTRARVENITFGVGEVFTNDDIVEVVQTDDVDPLSRRLPSKRLDFSIIDFAHRYDPDNPQGVYVYIDINSPISVQYGYEISPGNIEWLKPNKYFLDAKPSVQNNIASFSATGLIERLSDTFYKSKLGRKNFYDMAEEVLLDADLTPTDHGENPWVIDESLKDMLTTAVLPVDTHMNCLQLISHACRCRMYTDEDNIIHIEPFGVTIVGIYSGYFEDNGHEWLSEWDTVDSGNDEESTFVTLELNRWVLNSSNQIIAPDETEEVDGRGYLTNIMSDVNGTYYEATEFDGCLFRVTEDGDLVLSYTKNNRFYIDDNGNLIYTGSEGERLSLTDGNLYALVYEKEHPQFTKYFDITHDLPLLKIRFDDISEEYPVSLRVDYYDSYGMMLDSQNVDGITSIEATISSSYAVDVKRFTVTFNRMLPYWRARVSKVYYRETDFNLDFDTIHHETQIISKIDQLKTVTVAKYAYAEEDSEIDSLHNVDGDDF